MKVLKFGGTSLGDAQRMKRVARIATREKSLVVLSAVAGTTDSLLKITHAIKEVRPSSAKAIVEKLRESFKIYIEALFESQEVMEEAQAFVDNQLRDISETVQQRFVPALEYHVLAKGELISTELFFLYLKENGYDICLLSALDLLRLNEVGEPDSEYLTEQLMAALNSHSNKLVLITQGFICRNAFGEVANLKRGGSDYSASLFAAAINAEELQIWTDIDGMHNNDPRFVSNTQPIRELSFDEAAELAYFGAKILHPSSIKPARKKNISVKLLNTLEPGAEGTIISASSGRARIKAVAAKDGITAIKIKSSEMLQAPGFLRKVFEVFELYHTSIDVITTSEVAVSVTIDNCEYLEPIIKTLREFGRVEVDSELSIICVVGEFLVESKGVASQVIRSMEDIPVRMISYGGSAHNITLLISEEHKVEALNILHRGLFNV